jgi:FKBP-type peptidyl-prolyl cis-trans isomerase
MTEGYAHVDPGKRGPSGLIGPDDPLVFVVDLLAFD